MLYQRVPNYVIAGFFSIAREIFCTGKYGCAVTFFVFEIKQRLEESEHL